ncbi:hypothetical protein T06_12768, partial [Trichinella sp. T6]
MPYINGKVSLHKNRFPALRYANNDRHERCLIVNKGALVRLTYVASGSVVKRSLNMNNEEKKKRKHRRLVEQIADDTKRIADDTKRIADGTKQNKKRQKVYAVPRGSQFCKSGLGILRKALRYANNDRHERCLIVSKGALVRLIYVASGSVVKRSL